MISRTLDARILLALARGLPRRGSHAERLQAFYAPQAEHYDAFRDRLLAGRRELIEAMALPDGAHVVELGGGTGRNLAHLGERVARMGSVEIVDLCPALLARARERWAAHPNVRTIEADAASYKPAHRVDCIYLSYALTMMPNWKEVIENSLAMIQPNGTLGVVDFHVSREHSAFTRVVWPRWFDHDGVHLSPERLAFLRERLPDHTVREGRARIPYLPGLSVPYFIFVGRPS